MNFVRMPFPSSSSDRVYEVTDGGSEGQLICTCPAWRFNHGGKRQCKHIVETANKLGIDLSKEISIPKKGITKKKTKNVGSGKMKSYKGKEEGTLKVGQIWHDEDNGEPNIKILEIGEKLSTRGCVQMGASHEHLHSKVKAITEMDGEKEHWDAENLLDYLICNCYESVEE